MEIEFTGAQQRVLTAIESASSAEDDKKWDKTLHPRGGNPDNPGQFSASPGESDWNNGNTTAGASHASEVTAVPVAKTAHGKTIKTLMHYERTMSEAHDLLDTYL